MLVATYIAIALPVVVFMTTWFRWWIAVPAGLAIWVAGRQCQQLSLASDQPRLSYPVILLAIGVSVFWFSVSGAGGVGWQQGDWPKHYSMLLGLLSHSWPVLYEPDQPLVYYLAYYLLPALVGKVGGWFAAMVALGLETWVLYFLATLWIARLLGKHAVPALLLFSFFSGLDVAGNLIIRHQWSYDSWWARVVQYSSPADLMMFVPQHLAIGWLGTAAVLESDRIGKPHVAVYALVLSLCWSPFVTIGLAPLVGYSWWRNQGYRHHLATQWAVALTVFLPLVLFFQSRSVTLETYTWWMTGLPPRTFLTFMVLEWLLFGAVLWIAKGELLFNRPMVVLSLASLGIIPVLSLPGYSDFVMRASIPALFVVALEVIEAGLEGLKRMELRVLPLCIAFVVGALHPLGLYRQSTARFALELPRRDEVSRVPDLTNPITQRRDGLQYIGRTDTPFFEYLARR